MIELIEWYFFIEIADECHVGTLPLSIKIHVEGCGTSYVLQLFHISHQISYATGPLPSAIAIKSM